MSVFWAVLVVALALLTGGIAGWVLRGARTTAQSLQKTVREAAERTASQQREATLAERIAVLEQDLAAVETRARDPEARANPVTARAFARTKP